MKHPLDRHFDSTPWMILVVCASLLPALAHGEELKTTQNGVSIGAGSLGEFTLDYPVFLTAAGEPAHKIIETRWDGKTATVRYEDGGQVDVALGRGGTVTLVFAQVPADVKRFRMSMLVDIAFSRGGRWQIGDASGPFPREKPAKPHLHQANAVSFQLTDTLGQQHPVPAKPTRIRSFPLARP